MLTPIPSNAAFDADLSRLGDPESLAPLRNGIGAALALAPGEGWAADTCPILGYYFTSTPQQFLIYFVTPTQFIRYEVADGRSLTVALPLHRVGRVTEESGPEGLTVTVELDADATSGIFEGESGAGAVQGSTVLRGALRLSRTVYTLHASAGAEDGGVNFSRLAAFSLGARRALALTTGR